MGSVVPEIRDNREWKYYNRFLAVSLLKIPFEKPTPIQRAALPLILKYRSVVVRAKTGSGKTHTYFMPLFIEERRLALDPYSRSPSPLAMIILPTQKSCQQVKKLLVSLIDLLQIEIDKKVVVAVLKNRPSEKTPFSAGVPDILVSTPGHALSYLRKGFLDFNDCRRSLPYLILDDVEQMLLQDLKSLKTYVPFVGQTLIFSGNLSSDVVELRNLCVWNPYILTLSESEDVGVEIIPYNVEHSYAKYDARDKIAWIYNGLRFKVLETKVVLFTNSVDMSCRLKLLIEEFAKKAAVIHADLPDDTRMCILEDFNNGPIDYLVVTDNDQCDQRTLGLELIDFEKVSTVINYDLPRTAFGYGFRIGRPRTACATRSCLSLVSPEEMDIFEEVKTSLGEVGTEAAQIFSGHYSMSKYRIEQYRGVAEHVIEEASVK